MSISKDSKLASGIPLESLCNFFKASPDRAADVKVGTFGCFATSMCTEP